MPASAAALFAPAAHVLELAQIKISLDRSPNGTYTVKKQVELPTSFRVEIDSTPNGYFKTAFKVIIASVFAIGVDTYGTH